MSDTRPQVRRQIVASGSLGVGLVLVALLLVAVNYLGWKYHRRFDWTESRFYSLSDKSRNVLRDLDRDIEAIVFMTPGSELYPAVSELLSRFDAESSRFRVRQIDPERNPAEAKQLFDRYEVTSLNTVVFESGDDRRVIDEADLAEYDYSGIQFGQGPQITEFAGEQLFTGAILELVESRKPRILFTAGHGESALDDLSPSGLSQLREFLGTDNFGLDAWASLGQARVPASTDVVVIAGPTVAFLEPELAVLTEFLLAGGRVLLLLEPTLAAEGLEGSGFRDWLADYGVLTGENIVVDPANPLPFYSPETFFATDYGAHPITEALEEAAYPVIFSLARSVALGEPAEGLTLTELVRSSASAWGETDLEHLDEVEQTEADLEGPLVLAVAVEIEPPSGEVDDALVVLEDEDGGVADGAAPDEAPDTPGPPAATERRAGRLVVYGDADFASNDHLASVGNPTLLLNTVNWLAERENLLAIPARKAEQVQLNLTRTELSSIYWLVLVILPGTSLVAGVLVFLRRRR